MLVAVLAGCTPAPPVDPGVFETAVADPAVAGLEALAGLVAFGDVDVTADGRRFSGRIRAVYVAPDTIRLDVELPGFFGLMGGAGSLWTTSGELWWTDGSRPEPQAGLEDPVFGRVLGRVPTVRDLKVALFGLPAWLPGERPGVGQVTRRVALRGDPPRGKVRLEWADGWTEVGEVDGRPSVLRELTGVDPRGTAVRTIFKSHKTLSGMEIPERLDLRSPRTGGSIRLRWRRFDPDPAAAARRLRWPHGGTSPAVGLYLPE